MEVSDSDKILMQDIMDKLQRDVQSHFMRLEPLQRKEQEEKDKLNNLLK